MSGSGFPTENTEKKTPAEDTEEKIMFIKDCSINFIPENLWKVTYIKSSALFQLKVISENKYPVSVHRYRAQAGSLCYFYGIFFSQAQGTSWKLMLLLWDILFWKSRKLWEYPGWITGCRITPALIRPAIPDETVQ